MGMHADDDAFYAQLAEDAYNRKDRRMPKVRKVRRVAKPAPSTVEDESPSVEPQSPSLDPPASTPEPLVSEFDCSPSIANLTEAFVAFRKDCPNPGKDKQGHNYRYVSLANIIINTQELLNEHGLAVTQFPISSPAGLGCITMLVHTSGEYIRSRFVLPIPALKGINVSQEGGAAITYARRYAMSAVLCIAADEDTDATYDD